MTDEMTIQDHLANLHRSLAKVTSIVEEASQQINEDHLDHATAVLGSQDGKLAELTDAYDGLYGKLHEEGARPERAIE